MRSDQLAVMVAALLVLPGCTTSSPPPARDNSPAAARTSSSPTASQTTAPVSYPLGLLSGPLDFPAAHFDGRNGWRARVNGVRVVLVAGRVFLDKPDGSSVPYGALYTELDADLDPVSHRELQYRHTDDKPRGGYRVVGGDGYLVRVSRDDGRVFVFDLRTGRLRPA